jgi:hypothetical protein
MANHTSIRRGTGIHTLFSSQGASGHSSPCVQKLNLAQGTAPTEYGTSPLVPVNPDGVTEPLFDSQPSS